MEFLYTGNINNFTVNTAIEVIGLADAYTLDGLKRLCENCLIHNIEIDNACDLLIVANIYSAFELKKYAMNFIVKNFRQVNATAGFEGLE